MKSPFNEVQCQDVLAQGPMEYFEGGEGWRGERTEYELDPRMQGNTRNRIRTGVQMSRNNTRLTEKRNRMKNRRNMMTDDLMEISGPYTEAAVLNLLSYRAENNQFQVLESRRVESRHILNSI